MKQERKVSKHRGSKKPANQPKKARGRRKGKGGRKR